MTPQSIIICFSTVPRFFQFKNRFGVNNTKVILTKFLARNGFHTQSLL